jgi:hypothetical protein
MKNKSAWNLFFNPFTRIAGWPAFALGILIVLLTGVTGAYANVTFDGALDVHLSENSIDMKVSLLLLAIDIVSIIVVLFATGLILSKQLRFVDILGTMTLARAPLLLLSIVGLFVTPVSSGEIMADPMAILHNAGLIIFSVMAVLVLIWFIALMYHGFKVSTGAKGTKPVIGFIAGLIVAEIVSKMVIFQLF